MGLPVNFNPYAPIPNDPFYSAQNWFIQGWQGPLVLGFGLNINFADGTINAGSSSSGTVNQIVAGTAITVSPTGGTGIVTVNNAGVTGLVAGTGISLSGGTGNITVTATGGSGTVTLINSGSGLSGGPITTSGTLALNYACVVDPTDYNAKGAILAGTGVGSYSALAVGLDSFLLTACSSAANGVCWTAAPAAGIPCACITGKGSLVSGTAASTPVGVGVGANGQVLSANSACAVGLEWITPGAGTAATPLALGTVFACTENTGSFNTALGTSALLVAAGGAANVAIGASSGVALTTGTGNTLTGGGAACCLVGGSFNVANGYLALSAVTSGCFNIGIGANSGNALTTESCNVVIGGHPGIATQCNNVILSDGIGTLRLTLNSCGALSPDGTTFGTTGQVLCSNGPTGQWTWTTAAGSPNATPIAAGIVLGCTTASLTAIGCNAMLSATGLGNTAMGVSALGSVTTGTCNTAVGCRALCSTTGNNNTALGFSAGKQLTTGTEAVAIGWGALGCDGASTAQGTTAVGVSALGCVTTGNYNVGLGYEAGIKITSGPCNVAVGFRALGFNSAGVTGQLNVALGSDSLQALTAGNGNVAVGTGTGIVLTVGGCNTLVGILAGTSNTSGNNNILIGANATSSVGTVSNEVTVGNSSNNAYRIYAASWTNVSDARDKKDVEELTLGLDFVNLLKPVKYVWNYRDGSSQNGNTDIGFIAQDLLKAQTDAEATYAGFVSESNPEQLAIAQSKLIPVLVNAVKELAAEVAELKAKLK